MGMPTIENTQPGQAAGAARLAFTGPPKRRSPWRWLLIALAVALGAMGVAFTLYVVALAAKISREEGGEPARTIREPARAIEIFGAGRPAIGAADAPLAVVEFMDFQCPFCRQAETVVDQVLAAPEFAGKVRFVFRHFPLADIHPQAIAAAQAAECAYRQGKFAEMRRLLFQNQDRLQPADLERYAGQIGLAAPDFSACMKNEEIFAVIEQDWQDGLTLGVKGTPTYFIGSSRIEGAPTLASLKQAISLALTNSQRE